MKIIPDTAAISIQTENFESLANLYSDPENHLKWPSVFVLPEWIKTWWKTFGEGFEPLLLSIAHQGRTIGLALLKRKDETVSFMGSADICDYLDFVVSPGSETLFFSALLEYLPSIGVKEIDLQCLRPDSVTTTSLVPMVCGLGHSMLCEPDGVSFSVDLPQTWETYLQQLNSKQRHEVKRKIRRLQESGDVRFEVHEDLHDEPDKVELFFTLFKESRTDKCEFMTCSMESFFRDMFQTMSRIKILKMGLLRIDEKIVAALLYFDYDNTFFLYNNGYDVAYRSLSIGVLSKVFAIQQSIREKKAIFDFLKGMEEYKARLGGGVIDLSRCRIRLC